MEPGGSSGGGEGIEVKLSLGNTPGGLSVGVIDSSWLESPTTSAQP